MDCFRDKESSHSEYKSHLSPSEFFYTQNSENNRQKRERSLQARLLNNSSFDPHHTPPGLSQSTQKLQSNPDAVLCHSCKSKRAKTNQPYQKFKRRLKMWQQLNSSTLNTSTDTSLAVSFQDDNGYETDATSLAPSQITRFDLDLGPTPVVESFRDKEYPQLKEKVYLDHGGTTLYAKSLMERFSADMIANLYGNPHSASTPSLLAGHKVDAIREKALRFFNADPKHWDLIFTANATASIRLVADCFRDNANFNKTPFWYGYHKDAHTSLVGSRELAKAHRCFYNDQEVEDWIYEGCPGGRRTRRLKLFSYPGQSNMTGRRLPLEWCSKIRKLSQDGTTYTLLDAAALASTAPLDLSSPSQSPDFVALSFYKIFGFPNIGALLVQKQSQHVLEHRRYFGGGTVDMVIAVGDKWHATKTTSIHDRLEDGTLAFHNIFALDHAMDVHEQLYGSNPMKNISNHTAKLGRMMYEGLKNLHHHNGHPMVHIYKDEQAVYGDPAVQGSTVAMSILRSDGTFVGYADVEAAADKRNIYVRSGALCNPGGVATYLKWSPTDLRNAFEAGHRCSNPTQVMFGRTTGVVRVSMGAMSTASDVQAFITFLRETYLNEVSRPDRTVDRAIEQPTETPLTTCPHCSGQLPPSRNLGSAMKSMLVTAFPRRPEKVRPSAGWNQNGRPAKIHQ